MFFSYVSLMTSDKCFLMTSSELELENLNLILRRLRWFGHVEHSNVQSEQHVIYRLMAGMGRPLRLKLTWKKLTEKGKCFLIS